MSDGIVLYIVILRTVVSMVVLVTVKSVMLVFFLPLSPIITLMVMSAQLL
jgi:hypothetical protein